MFFDSKLTYLFDEEHSDIEDRWKVFGLVDCIVLVVSYTERDGIIRIIPARKAKPIEVEAYFYGYCTDYSN